MSEELQDSEDDLESLKVELKQLTESLKQMRAAKVRKERAEMKAKIRKEIAETKKGELKDGFIPISVWPILKWNHMQSKLALLIATNVRDPHPSYE